jgi:predicted amidohydrolase
VVGVNRIGDDGNDIPFCGGTAIINPKGEYVYLSKNNKEEVVTTEIELASLKTFREKFPVLKDV